MPRFLLKFHAAVIKEIPLEKTPFTIGRKPDNDVVIDNMAVSSHHARIIMQGNSYVVEDLKSTNGTFLNEKRIINSALKHNDQVLIGQHTLVFVHPDEQQQAAAPAEAQSKPMDSEATIVMSPQRQQQVIQQEGQHPPAQPAAAGPSVSAQSAAAAKSDQVGVVRVIEGKTDQTEYILSGLLTYIGKSDTAAIRIKGLFAPDIAALISKRPTGYLITAVKDGYPKLNSNSLSGQTDLKDGDLIEVGGLKLLFQMKEQKPE